MANNPATTATKRAAKPAASKPTSKRSTSKRTAAKSSAAKTTSKRTTAKRTAAVDTSARLDEIASEQSATNTAKLATLVDYERTMRNAVDQFEQYVAALVVDDEMSPTTVGKAIDLGNSVVRRIVWRVRPEVKPEGQK